MKLLVTITLLLFLGVSTIFSRAEVVLNFKVAAAKDLTYRIITNVNALNDYNGEVLATGKTDHLGQFSTTLQLESEKEVTLFVGNQFYNLWLGNVGLFEIIESEQALKFSGNYANENNILYRTKFMQPNVVKGYFAYAKNQFLDHAKMLDSLQRDRLQVLNDYKNKVSALFYTQRQYEITNYTLYKKSQFALLHNLKLSDLPADYYTFWAGFKVLPDDTKSSSYLGAIGDYIQFKVAEHHDLDRNSAIKKQFSFMDSILVGRPKTLETLKGSLILFFIKYLDEKEMIGELKSNFEKEFPNSDYTKLIGHKWAEKNSLLLKKPSFALKNTNGEVVKVETFRGNVVYIDFWGSWCKACLIEMPYAKTLREKFKNQKIIFLYLDFYDTNELWKKAIKSNEINGVNLKVENADEKYFDDFFGIKSGFPRYAVLDKNGSLITTAAPSPSSKGVEAYLEKLINQ